MCLGCAGDTAAPEASGPQTILPAPRDRVSVFDLEAAAMPANEERFSLSSSVALGVGPGYAPTVSLTLAGAWIDPNCADALVGGAIEIDNVTATGVAAASGGSELDAVQVSASKAGDSVVTAVGRVLLLTPAPDDCPAWYHTDQEHPIEVKLVVSAFEDPRSAIRVEGGCADQAELLIQSGAQIAGIRVEALDDDGEPVELANATRTRQATVRLSTDTVDAIVQTGDSGLGNLRVTGSPGTLTLTPNGEPALGLAIVGSDELTRATTAFALGGLGAFAVEPGQTYGAEDFGPDAHDMLFAGIGGAYVGDTLLCSLPVATDYRVVAVPSSTCSRLLPVFIAKVFWATLIETQAHIEASGLCTIEVQAPAFNGGEGWTTKPEFTLLDADQLVTSAGRE